jgi:hypothetical protein
MSGTGDLGFEERDCENALGRIFILDALGPPAALR